MEKNYRMVKVLDGTYLISENGSPSMILNDKQAYYYLEMHGNSWTVDDLISGCNFIYDQMDNGFIINKALKINANIMILNRLCDNNFNMDDDRLIKRNKKIR